MDKTRPFNRIKRPAGVKLIFWLVIAAGFFYFTRFYLALVNWQFLTSILSTTPLYFALSGLSWGIASLAVAALLWVGRPEVPKITLLYFLSTFILWWFERFFLQKTPGPNANWLLVLCSELLFLAWIRWLLYRPGNGSHAASSVD